MSGGCQLLLTVQSDWADVFVTSPSPSLAASSIWVNVRHPHRPLRTATLADFPHRRQRNDIELHIETQDDNDTSQWHVFQRGSPLISSSSSSSVATSAIDAAGQLVALGRDSGSVEIFNALTGELLRSVDAPLAHVGDVARVRFFPSGMVLLTCGIDGRAQIIDVADGEVAATLRAHAGAVLGAAMIDRGRSLITAGRDGSVRLWDVPTQTVVHAYDVSASAPLRDCCVDSESQFAWAVSDTGVLHGVDLRADHRSVALSTPLSDGQPLRACARRGAALWCGDESGVVRAVDARQPQRVLHELHRDLFVGQVTSLVVAGDALVVGTSAGLVLEYDAESGVRRRSFTGIDSDAVLLAHTTNALLATSTRAEADVLKFTTI